MNIHFISTLPRSGSTILCNILAQNPAFHTTPTSGCLDILFGVRNQWDALIEHQAHPNPEAKQRVLKAILSAYYGTTKTVFDKSRGWIAYLEMLEHILGRKVKVLVTVRQMPDILASMEVLYRETSKVKQPPGEAENYFQFQSVEGRCEFWLRIDNVVGLAYTRIKDAIHRGYRDRMHIVEFDKLTSDPKETLKGIYDFLEETPYEHDFDNVKQVTHENDDLHGYVNLHTIRAKVQPVKSKAEEILGKELVDKYKTLNLF